MKRFILLLLTVVMAISACACGGAEYASAFNAKILEINGDSVLVEPTEGQNTEDKIIFSKADLDDINVKIGDIVRVYYNGVIMESYPAQIHADKWELLEAVPTNDTPVSENKNYVGEWLDKETAESVEYQYDPQQDAYDHFKITEIYDDCFFARPVIPAPYIYKINYVLGGEWCVGDQVKLTFKNAYCDRNTQRMEVDGISVAESDFELEYTVAYKPVIYLYPETEAEVTVKLDLDGGFICTYPEYSGGWRVTALPDGTLYADGMQYNYLYWEGELAVEWDMSRGFCVKGEDTARFLEAALDKLGLNRKEANEFIVYWLPLMQNNPYNIISFQTEAYIDSAGLNITPAPDTLIRVFMTYKVADEYVEIAPQDLTAPERRGFTAVEWGGTVIL